MTYLPVGFIDSQSMLPRVGQQIGPNTEKDSQTLCKEGETLEHIALSGMSLSALSSQSSGNSTEKKVERL